MLKSQKGAANLIILGVVTLFAVVTAGYFVYQARTEPNDSAEKDKSSQQSDADYAKEEKVYDLQAEIESKDTDFKNYAARLLVGVEEYISNNDGQLPSSIEVVSAEIPESKDYQDWKKLTQPITAPPLEAKTIYYASGHICSADKTVMVPGSKRQIALVAQLPSGSPYCISS